MNDDVIISSNSRISEPTTINHAQKQKQQQQPVAGARVQFVSATLGLGVGRPFSRRGPHFELNNTTQKATAAQQQQQQQPFFAGPDNARIYNHQPSLIVVFRLQSQCDFTPIESV